MTASPSPRPAPSPAPSPPSSLPSCPLLPTVAVVGLGTLGSGLAELLADSGRRVLGIDPSGEAARRAAARVPELRTFRDLRAAAEADLVIEAVPEDYALKRAVLTGLDGAVGPTTILATATDALPVTRLAAETRRPERVLGLHFFHPVRAMRLVEVVASPLTATTAVDAATRLVRELGKEPLPAGDRPGFIADGLLFGYLNQAAVMYESRYAAREDIDTAMRLGCGLPMGPLALLDLIGVDTARTVLDALHARTGDRLYAPAPVLGQLATAGMTGRKAGRGFYAYAAPGSGEVVPAPPAAGPAESVGEPNGEPTGRARRVRTVGIAGSGTMAAGIAEVFARAGHPVVLAGRTADRAAAAARRVDASLERSVRRGRLAAAAREAALARLTPAGELTALASADLVVEAVAEDLPVKRRMFTALDAVCRPGAVLATTTSALPVVACARATGRPRDVVGMHFFNPAPAMRLVEVVRTVLTGEEALATAVSAARAVGKHPVVCGDRAGFVVNALLFPYLNNAVKLVQEHYATPAAVDTAMRLGGGYPMGPFELLDVVGLDVSLAILQALHREFREPSLAPARLLRQLVTAGCLGRKAGRGFHEYGP